MICEVCGSDSFREKRVDRSFAVEGRPVLVEHIPAKICERCGEATFEAVVAEKIRQLVQESHTPGRTIQAEVIDFNAA